MREVRRGEARRGQPKPKTRVGDSLRRRTVQVAVELQAVGASASRLKNWDVAGRKRRGAGTSTTDIEYSATN